MAAMTTTDEEKAVAWLHDVVEDADVTLCLMNDHADDIGVSEKVREILDRCPQSLTHFGWS